MSKVLHLFRSYPLLIAGVSLMVAILMFGIIGAMFVDKSLTRPGKFPLDQPPSTELWLGSDGQGRDSLAVVIYGTPLTLQVGFIAASIGLAFGVLLGFVGGYYGGAIDNIFRGAADILITIPVLLILVVLAVTLTGPVNVTLQALVIASVSWMWPTRTIRAQVLTMRERPYVSVASLSGSNTFEIIFFEMLPNLLPFIMASFVTAMAAALLTTIGMDALGLGPQNEVTLGSTIYWSIRNSAQLNGIWWWWAPPVAILGLVFISLYMVSVGMDKIANPKLRRL